MTENIPIIETTKKNYSPILISVFCIGIILFILFTQCEISNVKLKPKDASLVLIILALLAYINGYHLLFLLLLGVFIFIYFSPNDSINNLFLKFFNKEKKIEKPLRSIMKKPKKVEIEDTVDTIEIETPDATTDNESTMDQEPLTDSEITLDTDIELDEDIEEPHNTEGDYYMNIKKKI